MVKRVTPLNDTPNDIDSVSRNSSCFQTEEVCTPRLELEKTSEDADVDNPITIYVNKLNSYVDKMQTVLKDVKELVSYGKTLEKDFNQIVKVLAKKKKTTENKAPSGFAMLTLLTDEMYEFMDIPKGTKVYRNDVFRKINTHITENNLRKTSNKRHILPDETLHKLFGSNENDEVTYFNLQTWIKHHYIREKK